MAKRKPETVEVVDDGDRRYVVVTYADGSVMKKLVDPNQRPKRKPRKPIARAIPVVRPPDNTDY
jgi:hypothetical protein